MDVHTARELLACEPGAGAEALKRAYRRAALKAHPDKGGDARAFQRVAEAYQALEAARTAPSHEPVDSSFFLLKGMF